jgi:hypothetical protein
MRLFTKKLPGLKSWPLLVMLKRICRGPMLPENRGFLPVVVAVVAVESDK